MAHGKSKNFRNTSYKRYAIREREALLALRSCARSLRGLLFALQHVTFFSRTVNHLDCIHATLKR